MTEHDDEYLWSGQGTAGDDVAELERSLAPLRWRPQPLVLPSPEIPTAIAEVVALDRPSKTKWWPAVAAGLVAAAAVLALLLWPGPNAGVGDPGPTVNPAAPPLKDPFAPRDPAGFTAPITHSDPPVAPSVSPDLVDPFAARSDPPARPEPKRRSSDDPSSDLKNPFKDSQPADERVDPFEDRRDSSSKHSPDLKDPFARD
jgi:hypothetical protein